MATVQSAALCTGPPSATASTAFVTDSISRPFSLPGKARSGGGNAELEKMEARLMEMLATFQRQQNAAMIEADKLQQYSCRNFEARFDALEQRQELLEQHLKEVPNGASQQDQGVQPAEVKALRASMADLEKRATILERSIHGSGSDALQAVQGLEALLHAELNEIHRRCNRLNENIEDGLFPLRQLEQQVIEQSHQVEQLGAAGKEQACRTEEHEFRLGVMRTKMEVHDEKISLVDRSNSRLWRSSEDAREKTEDTASSLSSPMAGVGSTRVGDAATGYERFSKE
jgi:chromosome segregation ATPase